MENSKISFTVTTRFRPEERAELEQIIVPLTLATRAEPGCISYSPHWLQGEPATLLLYEQYRDMAAVEAHRAAPHFAEYVIGGINKKLISRDYQYMDAIV